jgi:hypothetical protein
MQMQQPSQPEVCPVIRLCRVLGSVRLGRSVTEGPFPKKQKTTINHLLPQRAEEAIPLDTPASVQTARDTLQAYFSSSSPTSIFAPAQVSVEAQDDLLGALDTRLVSW